MPDRALHGLCGFQLPWRFTPLHAWINPNLLTLHANPEPQKRQSLGSRIHFYDPALAFDGDDALFELLENRARIGQAAKEQLGIGIVVREDFDVADAADAVDHRLVKRDVLDV